MKKITAFKLAQIGACACLPKEDATPPGQKVNFQLLIACLPEASTDNYITPSMSVFS